MIDMHPDPDVPDSYYIDYDPNVPWQNGGPEEGSDFGGGSEMYEDPGSALPQGTEDWGEEGGDYQGDLGEDGGEGDGDEGEEDEEEEEGDGFDECVVPSAARERKSMVLILVPGSSPRRSW